MLNTDYQVVDTLRNTSRIEQFKARCPKAFANGQLRFVETKDIALPSAFDSVFKAHPDIEFLVHTASPVIIMAEDFNPDFIDPAIAGTLSVLSAAKTDGNIKRIVLTSSLSASTHHAPSQDTVITEDSWNPITIEQGSKDRILAYPASKKVAEMALWNFIDDEKPLFDAIVIISPPVFGTHLDIIKDSLQVQFGLSIFQQEKDYKIEPSLDECLRRCERCCQVPRLSQLMKFQKSPVTNVIFRVQDIIQFKELPMLQESCFRKCILKEFSKAPQEIMGLN